MSLTITSEPLTWAQGKTFRVTGDNSVKYFDAGLGDIQGFILNDVDDAYDLGTYPIVMNSSDGTEGGAAGCIYFGTAISSGKIVVIHVWGR